MPPATADLVDRLAARLGAQRIETHISWVLLTADLAFKLKKPVRLPFLDYSTLERRRHFCEQEVRLNRRLAPSIYLGVSRITGTHDAPAIDGDGPALEYAVRMRRFPPGSLFSERLEAGTLAPAAVDRLALRIADFHLAAPQVRTAPGATLQQRALAALQGCADLLEPAGHAALHAWITREGEDLGPLWQSRRAAGFARECHGDLHLANLLELDGEAAAFDCIEFDDDLRCIDVVEEVAFTLMDFAARGAPALGWRFLDGWLERTGDYAGVTGLRLCLVYRALVRATVEHLRRARSPMALRYAQAASAWTAAPAPRLFITHGLPGSGKTFASQHLLERIGAIRIRSDVERKRLHGLDALADSQAAGQSIYTPDATGRTYARLFELAAPLLRAGWPVVLDAAFLKHAERSQARDTAAAADAAWAILDCEAPVEVLRQRLAARKGDASEADAAVLEALRAVAEPLRPEERAAAWRDQPAR